jgi:thiol-disulfide isomerase/thioredoxin
VEGLGLDAKRQALEKRLLAEFGDSKEAEQVLLSRATLARANASARELSNVKEAAGHRRMLQEIIDRPQHHDPSAVERASTMLFEWAENDPAVGADELLQIVQGMRWRVKNRPDTVFARSATALARRGAHLDVAEKLARDGIATIPSSVSGARHSLRDEAAVRKYEKQLHATMRDALGYVLLQQGRVEHAETELRAALESSPASAAANLHLGQLFHKKGQLETAEDFYIKSYSGTGTAELHDESVAALERLYEERSGGKAGFDAYRAKLDGRARSFRKAQVSSEVGRDARRADDFSLDRLGGGKLTLASLEGKYTVIAFWGAWCSVCKAAMPELAKAFTRQQDDVAFLTINTDPNPEEVRTYMASNRYDFEVALDDGYAAKSGVTSVPQIWFLDKQGRKVFEIKGYDRTQSLEEQIDTRLALLRAN